MLKVGQIRKDNTGRQSYLVDLDFTPTFVNIAGYSGSDGSTVFRDFAIKLNNGAFKANTVYYIRVAVKRKESPPLPWTYGNPSEVNFALALYESQGQPDGSHPQEKIQTIEKSLVLEPWMKGINGEYINDEWQHFTVVFSPNEDYNYLCFRINRIGYDYIYGQTTTSARWPFVMDHQPALPSGGTDTRENTMDFDTNGDVASVNNILPSRAMSKIGIQSRPGSLFVVNREPIILGRSGIYEVNNGTKISSVGVIAPNGSDIINIQDFILDYGYDTSEEV